MLLYYLFWMLMGFILHFYIIFGTNLLTGGPTQIVVFFAYFRVSKKRNIKRSPNGMKPSGTWFSQQTWSRRLGVAVKKQGRKARGRGRAYPLDVPSTLVGPPLLHRRTSSCYIYIHVPLKHPGAPWKPNSITATFCTREIPSRGLFWSSAGGGIDHGGPLHQLHGLSGDVWVVYFRPTGP